MTMQFILFLNLCFFLFSNKSITLDSSYFKDVSKHNEFNDYKKKIILFSLEFKKIIFQYINFKSPSDKIYSKEEVNKIILNRQNEVVGFSKKIIKFISNLIKIFKQDIPVEYIKLIKDDEFINILVDYRNFFYNFIINKSEINNLKKNKDELNNYQNKLLKLNRIKISSNDLIQKLKEFMKNLTEQIDVFKYKIHKNIIENSKI